FKGCLIVVSHDRYFLDRLVDHLFVFEGNGNIRDFPGNYTDYRNWLEENQPEKEPTKPTAAPAPKPVSEEPRRKASYKEKKEFEELEAEIAKLEAQKQELIGLLEQGG